MWTSLLCLLLAGAVSAAPLSPFFNYLPHYGNPKQIFPPQFPVSPVGGAAGTSSFPTQGFIKYSLPKAPGRKSVEIFYPYDFSQRQIFPFDFMPQTVPQQPPVNPPFQDGPPQAQEPQQQTEPEQKAQTVQMEDNLDVDSLKHKASQPL
ncbi:hypothetical protein cypCar_00011005 [Cyprinus carpio]|nr:hypothetical protein cypCar_00011005 [Cyprinus carpio]